MSMIIDFRPNKTPIEVIKEGAFGGTYFRNMYSGINGKWYRKTWEKFDLLKDSDQKCYSSTYNDVISSILIEEARTLFSFFKCVSEKAKVTSKQLKESKSKKSKESKFVMLNSLAASFFMSLNAKKLALA